MKTLGFACDITQPTQVAALVRKTLKQFGEAIHFHQAADRPAALRQELPGSEIFQADITRQAEIDRMRGAV